MSYLIVKTAKELKEALAQVQTTDLTAVDVETKGLNPEHPRTALLGVSVSSLRLAGCKALYVPLAHFDREKAEVVQIADAETRDILRSFLSSQSNCIGHNFHFDQRWILAALEVNVAFRWDTQILWHLSSAPFSHKSYGLKRAQTEVLGWEERGDVALKESIVRNGGKASDGGQIYLADMEVLGLYAAKDAHSTLLLFQALEGFFNEHAYWPFAQAVQKYKQLLLENTREGILVDREGLEKLRTKLLAEQEMALSSLRESCSKEIDALEVEWLRAWVNELKTPEGQKKRMLDFEKHPRFNPSSDHHVADLLYGKLKFPISERTPKGKPKTNKLALKNIDHPAARTLLRLSRIEKLTTSFIEPYLAASEFDGRLHPEYNVTGTVSGRLSGFSPNVQQMPFKEEALMECFSMPEGRIGIHMDLVSIEPFFTAFFSRDETLLKVYRDGQGDIYLDLALDLFPENAELRAAYNPKEKPSSEVKARFKVERDIAKIVHLACQYGGGAGTIAKNLTLHGFPTSLGRAQNIVRAYWKKFSAVKRFEAAIYEVYKQEGKLMNPFGRVVRLPEVFCKDLLNRFIQGTASDCLKTIVMEIASLNARRDLAMKPLLIDVHDATTWTIDEAWAKKGLAVFEDALSAVNKQLELDFPVRGEAKLIRTFADIKKD